MVEWPNGKVAKLENVTANQRVRIAYEEGEQYASSTPATNHSAYKRFETVDLPNAFKHEENIFNDFEVEVLLPHKNSTLGPALATGDLNGDGRDDYIVGSAIGQVSAVYLQTVQGEFEKLPVPEFD